MPGVVNGNRCTATSELIQVLANSVNKLLLQVAPYQRLRIIGNSVAGFSDSAVVMKGGIGGLVHQAN